MDLIQTLAGQLGVDPNQAKAVAGAVLGQVQHAATEQGGTEQAEAIANAVPELGDWKSQAASMLGGGGASDLGGLLGQLSGAASSGGAGGLLAGLAGAASSGLGNDLVASLAGKEAAQQAQLVGLMSKLGLGADKAALVVPTMLSFLKDRLSDDNLDQLLKFAPMLMGGAAAAPGAGGLGGMMSGLFGKS